MCDTDQIAINPWLGADEEAFEDNSEEYIRRDLEGSGKNMINYLLPFYLEYYSGVFHKISLNPYA